MLLVTPSEQRTEQCIIMELINTAWIYPFINKFLFMMAAWLKDTKYLKKHSP